MKQLSEQELYDIEGGITGLVLGITIGMYVGSALIVGVYNGYDDEKKASKK